MAKSHDHRWLAIGQGKKLKKLGAIQAYEFVGNVDNSGYPKDLSERNPWTDTRERRENWQNFERKGSRDELAKEMGCSDFYS